MKKIFCVIGTRPEAIKMAPVIFELKKQEFLEVKVLATSQHREMLKQILGVFEILPDFDLDVMEKNQGLESLTAKILVQTSVLLEKEKPDIVLVQGDTTTVMAAAMAAFYKKIPIGHIEAGLRTGDMQNPYPEEFNRVLVSKMAKWHFAPTSSAKQNLLAEGVHEQSIYVTGNTVIDALYYAIQKNPSANESSLKKKTILITCHRRENFGKPLENICTALLRIAKDFPDVYFKFPVHPNPNISDFVRARLSNQANIILTDPLGYLELIKTLSECHFVLTDSGGIQEEAPALGKPVLVLREETERPEAVSYGVAKLVGTNPEVIYEEVHRLLSDQNQYKNMSKGVSPYGDGQAAQRIVHALFS